MKLSFCDPSLQDIIHNAEEGTKNYYIPQRFIRDTKKIRHGLIRIRLSIAFLR